LPPCTAVGMLYACMGALLAWLPMHHLRGPPHAVPAR
jgi:hypothetical protein